MILMFLDCYFGWEQQTLLRLASHLFLMNEGQSRYSDSNQE